MSLQQRPSSSLSLTPNNFFPSLTSLFLLIIAFVSIAQPPHTLTSAESFSQSNKIWPRARGPAIVTIPVKHGRAGPQGLLQTTDPLLLWCYAVDARLLTLRDSRRESALDTEEIYFTHNGVSYPANLSTDNAFNGTLSLEQVFASYAGNWTCHIRTKGFGNARGEIAVHLRPVVLNNASLRIDEKDAFHFEVGGVNAKRGEDTRLECPVYGHPKPEVTWRKGVLELRGDQRVKVQSDGALVIRNVTFEDGDTYSCRARNSANNKRDKKTSGGIIIERKLRVKSELAWMLPLGIIIAILVLLFVVILLCEIRKRRNEKRKFLTAGDGDEE
uniref:Ig-like domain-containing protein n=1 Tax=Globodera rostochiensis TaxID=31243 RepID=A0A914GRB6_GLORO